MDWITTTCVCQVVHGRYYLSGSGDKWAAYYFREGDANPTENVCWNVTRREAEKLCAEHDARAMRATECTGVGTDAVA